MHHHKLLRQYRRAERQAATLDSRYPPIPDSLLRRWEAMDRRYLRRSIRKGLRLGVLRPWVRGIKILGTTRTLEKQCRGAGNG